MILRRAVAGFRRHDWSAVAVELVVVVVGVFLGVQAANWNEDREQDKKSAVFTQRLKDDLRVEAWNYEIQIGYNRQVLANAERAADALTGKAPLPDEALLVAAYRATQFNGNSRRRATYDELTSTGEIGLIRDKDLRTLAMDVYTQPQIEQIDRHGQESEYRKAFRMALPWQLQRTLLERCGDHVVLPEVNQGAFDGTAGDDRNLFYVACSRPQKRLAILFTQLLSPGAMATLENWFEADAVTPAP